MMTAVRSGADFSLLIENTISEMTRVVDLVERFGTARNIPKKAIDELNLCLDEILNNTISYGYDDNASHSIRVSLTLAGNFVIADIVDDGKPFDPRQSTPPDPDTGLHQRRLGGVGLHFVAALMDGVEYARRGEFNHVTLQKKVAGT